MCLYDRLVYVVRLNPQIIRFHYYTEFNGGGQNRLMQAGIATASNQSPLLVENNGGGCFARLG